jgi:hypothetical protein
MRILAIGLALSASVTFGQSNDLRDRVFYLTHTDTVQQFQEVATVIRTIADIQQVSVDNDQRSVTVHATAGQIAMAEWLFNELDSPSPETSVPHEYRSPGARDDVVRVFYVTTASTVQDFQEVSTLVRTISEIRRVFTYNGRKALVVRGTDAQIGLAEWLVGELVPEAPSSTHEYRMAGPSGNNDEVVRVLRLPHTASVQDFQKDVIQIRAATQIKRIFTYNSPRAFAVRGTTDQIAMAERMTAQLNKP